MSENILESDEATRIAQHEAVKGVVRNEVNAEIENKVTSVSPSDQSQVNVVADQMKQRAITEIGSTESELGRAKTAARISQVIDYLFYLSYGLIGLQIVLSMLGASNTSGFKSLLNTITSPLLAPFYKLMPNPSVGRFTLMTTYIAALVV
jgi:hypothetical protein